MHMAAAAAAAARLQGIMMRQTGDEGDNVRLKIPGIVICYIIND